MTWTKEVRSHTRKDLTYTVKLQDGIFSCTCMAWKKQYSPIDQRTCKHLIQLLGEDVEKKRALASFQGFTRARRRSSSSHPHKHFQFKLKPMLFQRLLSSQVNHTLMDWYYSIKYNGAFARWNGYKLFTKSGRVLKAPQWLIERLPARICLDGELYAGKNQQNVVRKALNNIFERKKSHQNLHFYVFDLVHVNEPFEKRLMTLKHLQREHQFDMVKYFQVTDIHQLKTFFKKFQTNGEEGVVIRDPESLYTPGKRNDQVLKWKPRFHGRAKIVRVEKKKTGQTLIVKEVWSARQRQRQQPKTNTTFKIFVRTKREQLWKKNQVIQFIYYGRNENNLPDYPQIVR